MPVTFPMVGWRWSVAQLATALAVFAAIAVMAISAGPAPHVAYVQTATPAATLPSGPSAALSAVASSSPKREVEAIIRFDATIDSAHARAAVRAAGGKVIRDLSIIHGFGVRMRAVDARNLAAAPGVVSVTLNGRVEPASIFGQAGQQPDVLEDPENPQGLRTVYTGSIRAGKAWNAGVTGSGVGVAIVDTGIAGDLPDFRVSTHDHSSRVIASASVNPGATHPGDQLGHGTHIAGIIGGDSRGRAWNDPLRDSYRGVAPDANLIDVKVADDNGETSVLDVIYGLQFVLDHQNDLNIRVVNLSLNARDPQSATTDPLDAAVEELWLHGVVVVSAAGNRADAPDAVNYAPANDPYGIAVGGVDDAGTKNILDDTLAPWSSHGTTQEGLTKPDVLAPGAHIVSTMAPGGAYRDMCPSCVRDGDYFQVGGTSQAAAVVSGAVALVLQAHPRWTPDMVKGVLMDQSREVPGTGREVNVWRSLLADNRDARDVQANGGLTPSTLIDPATGLIDPARATWSRATWSGAADSMRATWSRATWSCTCDPAAGVPSDADPARATWSRATWSRATWSRATWSSSFDK